ncbi:YtxH domain-containing protein [Pedobacter psychroterrae]|uniref:YtxH domain-containing protein n=1 Tax=Pedobacter psychroterrae TaxID=2530453 RepID=A0A4V2MKA0_9SPHI|nr:YtxH domain-containing protein [Pedobacter psychroterrae]TCC97386.1 YtxH domain-containing protein [Pedobacter psychroterrae]
MNYRKLISNRISDLSNHSNDKSGAVIALLAGLAVGAVLGVLFAPDSGKKTREKITDKALDLADNAKDGLYSIKDKVAMGRDSITNLKDRVVDNVKSKVDQASQEFKEFRDAEIAKANGAIEGEIEDNRG